MRRAPLRLVHTTDFTALALRRVGTLFSVNLPDTSLQGFETLEEVGELSLRGSFQDLEWLSGLKQIRETATIEVSEELSEAEIRAFLAGVDVAGDAVVFDLSLLH